MGSKLDQERFSKVKQREVDDIVDPAHYDPEGYGEGQHRVFEVPQFVEEQIGKIRSKVADLTIENDYYKSFTGHRSA